MQGVPPSEVLAIVLSAAIPLKSILLPLEQAEGHCLSRSVRADRDQPPTDRSAMDGFAVRAADLTGNGRQVLRLVGESAAGTPAAGTVGVGTCVRVLTGGVVPGGADAVVEQERTRELSVAEVEFEASVKPGTNIRRRGENARHGQIVLEPGTLLGGSQTGLCASVGCTRVWVHRRPRVAVISTGSELRGVGESVARHQIRDSNAVAICAVLSAAGLSVVRRAVVADSAIPLAVEIRAACAEADVVLLSGGVSVGRYDYVPGAMSRLKARVRVHGVTMKPGKPLLYATRGRQHLLGLPGNPISALNGLYLFGLPLLRRLSGLPLQWCRPMLRVNLAESFELYGKRVEYRLSKLELAGDGWRARLLSTMGSGDQVGGALADGVVEFDPQHGPWAAGAAVNFVPWRPIW